MDTESSAEIFSGEASDPYSLAQRAYVWGFSFVLAAEVRQNLTSPGEPDRERPPTSPGAAINSIGHQRALSDPHFRAGVAPNVDTLYSLGWLDLAGDDFVLSVPRIDKRYYTFQLAYGDTSTELCVGSRTHGPELPTIIVAGPNSRNVFPPDALVVRCHTRYFQIAGRILVDPSDPTDFERVAELQRAITLRTWRDVVEGREQEPVPTPQRIVDEGVHGVPVGVAWLQKLANVVREEILDETSAALVASFAPIGLGTEGFDPKLLDGHSVREAARGLQAGREAVLQRSLSLGKAKNGWSVNLIGPRFGEDYLLRSAVAKDQIYVVTPEEALYPVGAVDDQGELLNGAHRYTITFLVGELPPAEAFWSLTMYRTNGEGLHANPIDRYAIGDRTEGLIFKDDGSLTIVIQNNEPTFGVSNWLPCPAGPFHMMMRLYGPDKSALSGEWMPPPIVRVG